MSTSDAGEPAAAAAAAAAPAAATAAAAAAAAPEAAAAAAAAAASSTTPGGDDGTPPQLDVAFVCDTTASMSGAIRSVQTTLKAVAEALCAAESRDLRLAAVEYKDHCDSVVVDSFDFTPSVTKLKAAIDKWRASGGGDTPEALADGLHAVSKLSWRPDATKLVVLCADAPPHGIGVGGDQHPKGCPLGLDPLGIAQQLAKRDVGVYTVGVNSPCAKTVSFLSALSSITGGRYLPLADAASLPAILVGGAEEELALAKFAAEMEHEAERVRAAAKAAGEKALADDEVHRRVASNLQRRGVKVKKVVAAQSGGGAAWDGAMAKFADASSLSSYGAIASEYAGVCASAAPRAAGGGGGGGYGAVPDGGGYGALPDGGGYGALPSGGGAYGSGGYGALPETAAGGPPAPPPAAAWLSGDVPAAAPSPAAMAAAPAMAAPAAQRVECVDDDISYEQVSRFMSRKAKARG